MDKIFVYFLITYADISAYKSWQKVDIFDLPTH